MSSTRTAKDDSTFHQNRYASSAEFERGLLANLVAKRCALIDTAADRELIWFVHYLSHHTGGLKGLAEELIKRFPGHFTVVDYDLEELLGDSHNCDAWGDTIRPKPRRLQRTERTSSLTPLHCIVDAIGKMCLDPATSLDFQHYGCQGLLEALRQYKDIYVQQCGVGIVVTELGSKVHEVLDYTAYGRGLTLMQGEARTGKSFAARTWCEQRPGLARFVEVPPSNDEASFFRALARGLGLGNFLYYKCAEIRDRVESVLLAGDIILVLDESQRLWPQRNLRYGFPSRIVWVMTMANANVPIAMVSTPQFVQTQKAVEKTGWNSAQLTGRISHYESLPPNLSREDLMTVARAVLPEAGATEIKALATYAQASARNLAAIDSISKRARFIAMRAGREVVTTADVRRAMQESVIPADTKLQLALATEKNTRRADKAAPIPTAPAVMDVEATEDSQPGMAAPRRGSSPAHTEAELPAPVRGGIKAVLTAA